MLQEHCFTFEIKSVICNANLPVLIEMQNTANDFAIGLGNTDCNSYVKKTGEKNETMTEQHDKMNIQRKNPNDLRKDEIMVK